MIKKSLCDEIGLRDLALERLHFYGCLEEIPVSDQAQSQRIFRSLFSRSHPFREASYPRFKPFNKGEISTLGSAFSAGVYKHKNFIVQHNRNLALAMKKPLRRVTALHKRQTWQALCYLPWPDGVLSGSNEMQKFLSVKKGFLI